MIMKKMLFALIVLGMMPSFLVHASGYEVKGKAGDYNVEAMIDRNPPGRGNNNIEIVIKDKTSKLVTDAQIQVQYLMPSLPGKPPMMEYITTAKATGDHYQAQMDLSMAGKWTVVLRITRAKKTATMKFTFVVK
jgi:hypothetical protein